MTDVEYAAKMLQEYDEAGHGTMRRRQIREDIISRICQALERAPTTSDNTPTPDSHV